MSDINTQLEEPATIDYRKFDFDGLIYNKPRKERGKYIGKVKYKIPGRKSHDKIIIKTPRLKCLDDLRISDDRCILELELSNNNIDFYQFLINMDDKNITAAYINSKHWFGQQFPMDIIDEFYKPFIKMNRNKNPSIKVRIIYEELKNFDLEELKKDQELFLWIECTGLRFLNQQFTMFWNIVKVQDVTNSQEYDINEDYYDSTLLDKAMVDVAEASEVVSVDDEEQSVPEEKSKTFHHPRYQQSLDLVESQLTDIEDRLEEVENQVSEEQEEQNGDDCFIEEETQSISEIIDEMVEEVILNPEDLDNVVVKTPIIENQREDKSKIDKVEEDKVEEDAVEEKIVEEKIVEEKIVEEDAVEKKVVEEKVVEEKVVEENAVKGDVVEEKVVEEVAVEEDVVKEDNNDPTIVSQDEDIVENISGDVAKDVSGDVEAEVDAILSKEAEKLRKKFVRSSNPKKRVMKYANNRKRVWQ